MSSDTARSPNGETDRTPSTVRAAVNGIAQLLGDLVAVSLWVLFLTLLFLETAWPRWAFYALLLVGVGAYVSVTTGWLRGIDEN